MNDNTINDMRTIAGGAGMLLADRYRIVRQLGQGGMGNVWLAEDTQLDNKSFAIKMLPSILVSNKRAYRQLKDEALVAMRLVYPNIVQIRAFEENNGNPFLVMDYVEGQTLDDYLAGKGKLGEDDAINILRPIAAALDYAHAKGVVHRDVKPGNVMIAKDGTPYILDFGIAREIQETMTRVTGKLSSGTLLYMSPEQLMGEQPRPTQDIYSFAAMAYECLKGEPPFSHGQIEFQIMNKQPAALTGEAAILAAGVMAGLAKKPEDRPATCAAVLEGSVFSHKEHKDYKETGGSHLSRPDEAKSGRARSPSGPSGPQTLVDNGHGRGQRGASLISIPKSDWRYLPPGMRPSVKESRTFSPRDIPEGDRRYLPPDMRGPLQKDVPNSKGKQHDDGQRRGDGVALCESQRSAKKPCADYSWKFSVAALAVATILVLVVVSIHRQQPKAEHDAAIAANLASVRQRVQLWEGGPYWATTNIGAEKPEDYGYYFWWGDTVGCKREGKTWVASDGSQSVFSFGKENTPQTYGKDSSQLRSGELITAECVLAPKYDAAHAQWGGEWRMPTWQELDDLKNKCDWTWKNVNGVNGYEIRGKGAYASAFIFLPCTGYGDGASLGGAGSGGFYWSSVPYSDDDSAWYLDFNSGGHSSNHGSRYLGYPVRPVQGFTKLRTK